MARSSYLYVSLFIVACIIACSSDVYSQTHNITALGVTSPAANSIIRNDSLIPISARFLNSGFFDESNVMFIIESHKSNGSIYYRDTQIVQLFKANDTMLVKFKSRVLFLLGEHTLCAISRLSDDIMPLDDTTCSRFTLHYSHDYKAVSIIEPKNDTNLPAKTRFTLKASFTSIGQYDFKDVPTRVRIRDSIGVLVYQSDTTIPRLSYDSISVCTFPATTKNFDLRKIKVGKYQVSAIVNNNFDGDRNNDTCTGIINIVNSVLDNDVKVDTFIVPTDSLWGFNSTIPIKFSFTNIGKNIQHNVKVYATVWNNTFKKYIYQDSAIISQLGAGETRIVSFGDLKIPSGLNYGGSGHFGATIAIQADEYPEDNHRSFFHNIGYANDLEVSIDYPSTIKMRQGTVFNPKAKVSLTWVSYDLSNIAVMAEIRRCDNDLLMYSSQLSIPLLTYDSSSREVTFPIKGVIGTTKLPVGCYNMIIYTSPIANSDPSNNFASTTLMIYDKTDNNIKATSIVSPMNNSVSYGKFKVLASYTSTGLNDQKDVMVTTMIKDPSQNIVYRDTVFIANAKTILPDTISFRLFTPLTKGKFTVYSISHLVNDETTKDDTLMSTFEQDRHADIHISYIPYPTLNDTIIKGNEFICKGEFWLLGDSITQLYSVPVRVLLHRNDNGQLVFQADTTIDVFFTNGKVNAISFPSKQGLYNNASIKGGYHTVCMMPTLNTYEQPHDSTCGLFTILPIESSAVPLQGQYNKNIRVENFPNPFSTKTTLTYEVTSGGYVTMRILDISGVTIETVMSDVFVSGGKHEVTLDGSHLPSGTYFVEVVFKDSEGTLERKIQPVTVQK